MGREIPHRQKHCTWTGLGPGVARRHPVLLKAPVPGRLCHVPGRQGLAGSTAGASLCEDFTGAVCSSGQLNESHTVLTANSHYRIKAVSLKGSGGAQTSHNNRNMALGEAGAAPHHQQPPISNPQDNYSPSSDLCSQEMDIPELQRTSQKLFTENRKWKLHQRQKDDEKKKNT